MKAACHIKSYQMSFDKQTFEKLPEFYKTGLYCCEMLNNVRIQKDFILKKSAFEVHKEIGIELLRKEKYDDANYSFCKSLCIFKYIKNKNKNWKNEGIKDEDLMYCEDKGSNPYEENEINKMKISALLNISLCDLNMEKFTEVRNACDEIIKLDPTNVKAYYRKAKSYLDCKSSLLNDYKAALEELNKALKYSPENAEIIMLRNNLNQIINNSQLEEKKVFKSFFRNVNYVYEQQHQSCIDQTQTNTESINNFTKVTDEDSNVGKPEIRILNLIIEQCYVLIDRLERDGDRVEKRKIQQVVDKAKIYKEDLQKLLELNFENPNDSLKEFAEKNNLDLKDSNIKEEFFNIRKQYLDKINKFYEENLLKHKEKDKNNQNLTKAKKLQKIKKSKEKITQNENNKTIASNLEVSNKVSINYTIIFTTILFILIIIFLVWN